MKKKFSVKLTVFATVLMFSCQSEEAPFKKDNNLQTNEDVFTSLAIKLPSMSSKTTRATPDNEFVINTLDVYVYDAADPSKSVSQSFSTGTDLVYDEDDKLYKTTKAIKVSKQTDKYIYVGVNLTAEAKTLISTNGIAAFGGGTGQDLAVLAFADFAGDDFMMFNNEPPAVTTSDKFHDTEANALAAINDYVQITVDRVVAKASIQKMQTYTTYGGGGTLSDALTWGWRNINKSIYLLPYENAGVYKDPNWDTYAATNYFAPPTDVNVNEYGSTPLNHAYATENCFDVVNHNLVKNTTFVSIQGVFTPTKVLTCADPSTATQRTDFTEASFSDPSGTTFYAIQTQADKFFYFKDEDVAEKFFDLAEAGAPDFPVLKESEVRTYDNGKCYFHVFVGRNETAPYAPYNVYRNKYYKISLKSLMMPGFPTDDWDSGNAVATDGYVGAEITVSDWEETAEENTEA
ncbi:Mfa1 family fimbria major subunit [Parabacteroides sp. PF5-9]|uniref:Mfa1 family fimbria major subunit n=1 Tax=Parabacteroides sp. PF5-9 TaxID=1742404 RepID=UPI0024748F84|nr:Mfa1 family fimbria major subunit [Parabacteroides sp. PF5-9]MDH6357690.1 hypothetical protein [Parabacteroides sp. PF5-9]